MTYRYNLSVEDVRLGLKHPMSHMRIAFVKGLKETDINPVLIEKCLSHQDVHIRLAMATKCIHEYAGSFPLTQEQFKRGLIDKDTSVKSEFASCMDWPIGEAEVDIAFRLAAISNLYAAYVQTIMMRSDFNPTESQCYSGVTHSSSQVRKLMTHAINFKPTLEMIAIGLKDPESRVREWYAGIKDFKPSAEQIKFAIDEDLTSTGVVFIKRNDCEFSKIQHNSWLMFEDDNVKRAIAKHYNFLPTQKQIEYGLAYKEDSGWFTNPGGESVSSIFESRIEEWKNKEERLKLNKMVGDSMKNEKNTSTRGVL